MVEITALGRARLWLSLLEQTDPDSPYEPWAQSESIVLGLVAELEGAHRVLDLYGAPEEGSYPFADGDGSKTEHSLGGRIAAYHQGFVDVIQKAIGLLLDWLEATDYIDCIIHTDRFLRDLCNCENEL